MVIPKRCMECGNVFDLSYDFVEGEEPSFLNKRAKETPKEFLCYYCREKEDGEEGKNAEEEKKAWLNDDILKEEEY